MCRSSYEAGTILIKGGQNPSDRERKVHAGAVRVLVRWSGYSTNSVNEWFTTF